jgi:DNA polymerase I-like protein with 3'-5' exonuclease and polymerase domains
MISKLNSLSDNAVISADTETTSLNGMSKDARILTFQFGFRDPNDGLIKAFVIPLWHIKNTMYDPNEAWKLLAPLLTGPRKKCFQNGKFDILYCYHTTGIRIRNVVFDTMFNEHALDSGKQGCLGLKAITWDRLPHTGLGGYESLLPKLLKNKASDEKSEELENASSVEI